MGFTDNCDIYAAIYDAGINRVVKHVMQQRPSLFNYGTALVAHNPQLLCAPIDAAPEVVAAGNPLLTVLGPLPVISTPYGLNFCAQLSKGEIDFYPGNVITLPADLNPPLPAQRLAFHVGVFAGIGCPSGQPVIHGPPILPPLGRSIARDTATRQASAKSTPSSRSLTRGGMLPPVLTGIITAPLPHGGITVLPTHDMECFCLDLFATCGCTITGVVGNQKILPSVYGINIPELKPEGMEESLECYALVALNQGILPQLGNSMSQIAFGLISLPDGMGDLQVSASTAVPNNPAIEDDQLKVFIDLDKVDVNVTLGLPHGGGVNVTRTTRARTRTGTFDLTAAISSAAFRKIYSAIVHGFKFHESGSGSYGPFSVSYQVDAHLEGGSIQLNSSGGVEVNDVKVKWDTLKLTIGFNLPEVCTPGFCLVPNPFSGGCAVGVDPQCLFSGNPDLSVSLDVGGFLESKATVTGIPRVYYGVGHGVPNQWQIAVEPTLPIYIEIIDIADTVADLFNNLMVNAIDNLLSGLPGWAQDLVDYVLGGVDDIIRTVLGIPDDIGEWIVDMITGLGIFQDVADALSQYIAITVFAVDDPYTVLPVQGQLIPVKLPIEYLGLTVDNTELVVRGDIGD